MIMDPLKHSKLYSHFVLQLSQDEIELSILEYLTELIDTCQNFPMYPKKVNQKEAAPAKQVLDYFVDLYYRTYNTPYLMSNNKVGAYTRIANFIRSQKISVDEYKQFINKAFEFIFNENFTPGLGHIVSSKIFDMVKNNNITTGVISSKKVISPKADFKRLRDELRGKK